MLTFTFTLPVAAHASTIWPFYANINLWKQWEEDLEHIELYGEFATGTEGRMKLKGMDSILFTLTSVIANKAFWDTTTIPHVGSLSFGHEIIEGELTNYIKHTVTFESATGEYTKKHGELIQQVFADVPDAMWLIKKEAEQG